MGKIDLTQIKKVFFIGIGGIGISALAKMMYLEGKTVVGNDLEEFSMITKIKSEGINVHIGIENNAFEEADLYVYSIAWETLGPEFLEKARATGKPVITYPEMLGIVTEGKYTIAVAGAHGKTTTTAMIGSMLRFCGADPSMVVGSLMVGDPSTGSGQATNYWAGKSEYFVVESCEYKRSFLNINPKILVITNIEADHLDYYKDLDDIVDAFHTLAMKVPNDGYIVCDTQDNNILKVIDGVEAQIVDCNEFYKKLDLKIPGIHYQFDASLARSVSSILKLDESISDKGLENFPGTARRFEYKGNISDGALVYDDYAHHPTEVRATLLGFRELYPKGEYRVTVIFQPHLFSRTKTLFDDFINCFALADKVIILPIYQAREIDDGSISSQILAIEIKKTGVDCVPMSFDEAKEYINNNSFSNKDILVTMGAGEADQVIAL